MPNAVRWSVTFLSDECHDSVHNGWCIRSVKSVNLLIQTVAVLNILRT